MFDEDIRHYRRVPRTLNEAFGAYSKLSVQPRQSKAKAWAWSIGYGVAAGVFMYLVVLWKC